MTYLGFGGELNHCLTKIQFSIGISHFYLFIIMTMKQLFIIIVVDNESFYLFTAHKNKGNQTLLTDVSI